MCIRVCFNETCILGVALLCIRDKRGTKRITKQSMSYWNWSGAKRGRMSTEQIGAETVGSDKISINHKSTSLETQGRQMKIAGCRCSQSGRREGDEATDVMSEMSESRLHQQTDVQHGK